jgi:hypothetical protein
MIITFVENLVMCLIFECWIASNAIYATFSEARTWTVTYPYFLLSDKDFSGKAEKFAAVVLH